MDYHGTTGNDILDQLKLGIPDNSSIYGDAGDDTITIGFANADGGPGNDTIIGTNGASSAVYWDSLAGVTVDLQTGQAKDSFGTIDTLINIHSIHGSYYADTLLGDTGDDRFWAGRGDDYIDGRDGVDTVSFFFSPSTKFGISYDATNDLVIVKSTDPADSNFGTKTLKNVEILQFEDVSILTSSLNPNYKITLSPTKSATPSVAGIWTPNGASDPVTHNGISLANAFYSQITLANGRNGLVLNGWSYNGWDNETFYPVNATVLEQNADGTLTVATGKYLPDSGNNGSGSVLVADFNGDGKQDIFLAAHNESPFITKPSTAYLSNADGSFSKTVLSDSVTAHGGLIGALNGMPTVFVGSYSGDRDPYYQFIHGEFVQTSNTANGGVGGCSVAVADFNGDGLADAVYADCNYGPGIPYVPGSAQLIVVYKLSDAENGTGTPEVQLSPYFNGKAEYANIQSLNGFGQTHTYRVWVDDFNHDAKTDILAGGSLWSASDASQNYSILQFFQNTSSNGAVSFTDKTDALNSQYIIKSLEVDYSMQMIDIDHSGINTYFIAGGTNASSNAIQDNYILLNDGTGWMHIYMHDQFQSIGEQVKAYLGITNFAQPRFIEYQTANGNINLEAEISISIVINGNPVCQQEFVNVPLQLNPTVDYTDNITISDRNGSMLMRTWAGNDTFYDTNANPSSTSIDGGLGIDTSTYSHTRQQYLVKHNIDGTWGVTQSVPIADTLRSIERLKFSDGYIALDVGATQPAGETQLLLGAVLGKDLLATKQPLIGAVIDLFDQAYTLQQLSGAVMRLPIWDVLTGKAVPTSTDIANYLLWRVNGATPNATTLASAVGDLDAQPDINHNQGDFLWHLVESSANQAQVGLVGLAATGLAFTV